MCDAACQKLLLCAACGGEGLLVQHRAQHLWLAQGDHLSDLFQARQYARCLGIQNLINECFARIHWPPLTGLTDLQELGHALVRLSHQTGLSDADNIYCIERADQCEDLVTENQDDYLNEIGYVAA